MTKVLNVIRYCDGSPFIAGTVETYAMPGVKVMNVSVPYVAGVKGELLGEQYVEQILPSAFRGLFLPGRLAARGEVDKRPVSSFLRHELTLTLFQQLDGLRTDGKEGFFV